MELSKLPIIGVCHEQSKVRKKFDSYFRTAPPTASFSYRKYKDITPHNSIQYLETCDRTALLSSDPVFDLESGLSCLSSNLQMAIEELAPLKTVTQLKGNRPWVGPDLQFLIRKYDAIHARYGMPGCLMNFWNCV